MNTDWKKNIIELDISQPIWDRFYMVSPLVVIGTKELNGYDLAPKHMAMPLGWNNYFCFVCTPRHKTYHNAKEYGSFTVSFPVPNQVLMTSLAATLRVNKAGDKMALDQLETVSAEIVDGVFLKNSYLYLECNLERVVDGFGINSLIIGEIVASYVSKTAVRKSGIDNQQLLFDNPLLAYLPPDRFSIINETIAFPFPANFEK